MQTRQAGETGGEEGSGEETSRLGFVSHCPGMSGGQRGGRTPRGTRAGPGSAIVRKQKSHSCPGCSGRGSCHISEGARSAVSTLAESFAGILSLGIHRSGGRGLVEISPPARQQGLGGLGGARNTLPSFPQALQACSVPPRCSARPKRHVPPGTWHRACVFHFIPSPLATPRVFGVYIPGCLDTVPPRPHSWSFPALPIIG